MLFFFSKALHVFHFRRSHPKSELFYMRRVRGSRWYSFVCTLGYFLSPLPSDANIHWFIGKLRLLFLSTANTRGSKYASCSRVPRI